MDTYPTVNDLKEAILKAQKAVEEVQRMFKNVNPEAIVVPDGKSDSRNTGSEACPLIPAMGPIPIHPGGVHCWLTFPLTMGDVINPVQSMHEMLGTILTVLDAGNRNMPLPRG